MGLSREIPRMVIQFEFMIKMQDGKYNVRYFGWFILDMSPDGTAFKVHSFISDFEFWIGVNEY